MTEERAFPTQSGDGLTKKEYFAGQALIGILSMSDRVGSPKALVSMALMLADEMIRQTEDRENEAD
jgi:hypothetical protein